MSLNNHNQSIQLRSQMKKSIQLIQDQWRFKMLIQKLMKVTLKMQDLKNLNFLFYHITNKVYNIKTILILGYEFMFVTMIEWLHRCCWRMLVTKCVSGKFEMLVTDSGCWCLNYYIEKITNITNKVANIMILPPTSEISHHHKVTKITMSST